MKKIVAVCTFIAVSLPILAQGPLQLPRHFYESMKQNGGYTASFETMMQTLDKPLLLTIPVTKQYCPKSSRWNQMISFEDTAGYRTLGEEFDVVKTYPSTAGCKAYALDEHWVMAGGTCLWNARHTTDFTPSSASDIFDTGLVEPNVQEKNLKVNGGKIAWRNNLFIQPREHKAPHVILVRVPEKSGVAELLKRWPKINLLAFSHTHPLDLEGGEFYINSSRFGSNSSHKRTLTSKHNVATGTLKDRTGQISGVSTDPLVFIKNNKMRWMGVNQGVTELRYGNLAGDWDGKPSNEYFYFNAEDAAFIKDTISKHDPAAWQRIEARKGLEIL